MLEGSKFTKHWKLSMSGRVGTLPILTRAGREAHPYCDGA